MESKPSLLLVDDDEGVVRSFSRTFGHEYDVTAATSGEAALATMATRHFDVAVLDYGMPGMNGVELLKRMDAAYPEVPRIMLTGYADVPEIISLKDLELVIAVLMKPWERAEVEHAVSRALHVAAMRSAVSRMLGKAAASS